MSNSGSARNYRESSYQQQYPSQSRGDNYNNQASRRSNNFTSGNGNRGRRGGGAYRGGTQSDAGTGGKHPDYFLSLSLSPCRSSVLCKRDMRQIIFIFADEASECGDASSSSTFTTSRKHRDWAAQVESEQQQETGYSTDSVIDSATLPRGAGGRGGRRGWRRARPPLPHREGAHTKRTLCCFPLLV